VLFARTSATYCAPWSRRKFSPKLSVVSVYVKIVDVEGRDGYRMLSHLIVSESIYNMLCSFVFYLVILNVQCTDCLNGKCTLLKREVSIESDVTVLF